MHDHDCDDAKLAAKLRKLGRKASAAYIAEVVSGYYAPSRKLARALSEITGVDAGDILTFEYRAKRES